MGLGHRTLKRVPLDFNWPLGMVWKGYINPHPGPSTCPTCFGSGYNAATEAIKNGFYGFGQTKERWCDKITQDEVLVLVMQDRLADFTHVPGPNGWTQRVWNTKGFWCPTCMVAVPQLSPEHTSAWCTGCQQDMRLLHGADIRLQVPTADQVNAWEKNGLGHDSINAGILIEARARRLGVYGLCPRCHGHGVTKLPRKMKKRYTSWVEYEPPAGPGYQLWETCTEGSPISPVFGTPEELASWCALHATVFADFRATSGQWLQMFLEDSVDAGTTMVFAKEFEDPRQLYPAHS